MTSPANHPRGSTASAPNLRGLSGLQALHRKRREERRERVYGRRVTLFLLAHPLLAAAMKLAPWVPTVHALATLGLGLFWLFRYRNPDRIIPLMGYIVSSEILWRGTHARIFWEFGKYSISLLAILALVRFGLFRRATKSPIVFFALLTPSILAMPYFDREMVAFNLSGPFALAVTTAFLSTRTLDGPLFKRLLLSTLAPILGLASLAAFSTLTAGDIQFYSSTSATSAGIGPNQVSSILGLGALLAFLYLLVDQRNRRLRWLLLVVGLWLGAQSALTFSRGGLVTCLGAVLAGSFFLLQDRRSRGALILRSAFAAVVIVYLVFPVLNDFTGGALAERFASTHLTGRDKIMEGDLLAFKENPILGTGPGGSKPYHELLFRWSSAHTEYTRILAEHGSAGLLALLVLLGISTHRALRRAPPVTKAFTAAMTTWALLYMFHSAMRLAAPSLIFGLGGVLLSLDLPAVARRPVGEGRDQGFVPGPRGAWQRRPVGRPVLQPPAAASQELSRP